MDKNKFLLSVLVAVLGLMMVISPDAFIALVVIILGVGSVVNGIFVLATTRNLILDPQYKVIMTIRGVMAIIVGSLAVLLPLGIAAVVWKFMAYTLAIFLIISAGLELYGVNKLYRNGIMIRQSVIEVVISLILAVVLFIIPAEIAGGVIVRVCGVLLLAAGIISGIMQWRNRPLVITPEAVCSQGDAVQEEEESGEEASEPEETSSSE